jgi:hypothetical protein
LETPAECVGLFFCLVPLLLLALLFFAALVGTSALEQEDNDAGK